MSERRLKLMDVREMVRHIREGRSDRQIGKDLDVDRRTVKRYRLWAQEQGLLEGDYVGVCLEDGLELSRVSLEDG